MRNLAKTEVMKSAAIAALVGSVICYPRLVLWSDLRYPVWYLEAVLLVGGFVLWAFVFAWHAEYTKQPVFTLPLKALPCFAATLAGFLGAFLLHQFVDPAFRTSIPEDYPTNLRQWSAMTLFSLGFTHLLLIFAPFDWSLRLTKSRWIAMLFTVIFGVFVVMAKFRSSPTQIPASLLWALLLIRATTSTISVWFYSSYGAVLTCWWSFLLQTRHLFNLLQGS